MKKKLHTDRVVVVEGKYDAARLAGILDATILQTDGFGIYTDFARQKLLKQLAKLQGLLILTDPDAAGFQIRTFVTNLAGAQHVLHAYVPAQQGKERRKAEPGKEGLLGVEGISDAVLYQILESTLQQDALPSPEMGDGRPQAVTYTDLYEWGLSGTAGAAARKTLFLQRLGLPPRLSKKELVDVLNRLYTRGQLETALAGCGQAENEKVGKRPNGE